MIIIKVFIFKFYNIVFSAKKESVIKSGRFFDFFLKIFEKSSKKFIINGSNGFKKLLSFEIFPTKNFNFLYTSMLYYISLHPLSSASFNLPCIKKRLLLVL